jgi:hypothetical protein
MAFLGLNSIGYPGKLEDHLSRDLLMEEALRRHSVHLSLETKVACRTAALLVVSTDADEHPEGILPVDPADSERSSKGRCPVRRDRYRQILLQKPGNERAQTVVQSRLPPVMLTCLRPMNMASLPPATGRRNQSRKPAGRGGPP